MYLFTDKIKFINYESPSASIKIGHVDIVLRHRDQLAFVGGTSKYMILRHDKIKEI